MQGPHGTLKRYVAGEHLWYVLLHMAPVTFEDLGDAQVSRYVALFAVGQSPHAGRLIGVVTHQACHNLCD